MALWARRAVGGPHVVWHSIAGSCLAAGAGDAGLFEGRASIDLVAETLEAVTAGDVRRLPG